MGSGKTRLGKELAPKLGMPFVDLDRYIERATGQTIKEIFEAVGEERFREIERGYLAEVSLLPPAVVSLGGGTPCFFDNMQLIKQTGTSIYIKLPLSILAARLQNGKTDRPLLAKLDKDDIIGFLQGQLAVRESFYSQADFTLASGGNLKAMEIVKLLST